ncbi:ATP-binding protein [Actinomadura atramentaria]|uniref:ATP-binding protein n=1 Tax=Actinomadura atramentaria TaxID=1990 RepID=UPI0003729792|nr:ATP-binding protein [Actinomadura atramentaria]
MARLSRLFPGRADAVHVARSFAWAFVVGRVSQDVADTVELVVSELATNAVEHTASGQVGGSFVLELDVIDGAVRVGVVDMGSSAEPSKGNPDDLDAVSGRGLFIVDAVAKQWAAEPVRFGRRVWADLAMHG